jgi:hypothetical protein
MPGDLPERVMRTFNAYEKNHTVSEANIRSAYKHKREFEDGKRAGMNFASHSCVNQAKMLQSTQNSVEAAGQ